jgi:3-isopropylmalate/(R)-2-methylmalate dehydratase large subunit
MAQQYSIKYFYDITDRSNFKANPDYKGVCHVALAQVGSLCWDVALARLEP